MRVKASTPTAIKEINTTVARVNEARERLKGSVACLFSVYERREVLRAKMVEAGVPGSDEPFNVAALNVKAEAAFLRQLADSLDDNADMLLTSPVERWGLEHRSERSGEQ